LWEPDPVLATHKGVEDLGWKRDQFLIAEKQPLRRIEAKAPEVV
jgi:hypothetical protein